MKFDWQQGDWRSYKFHDLGLVPIESIGCPWSWNIFRHLNYDRLFWSIYNDGIKTPLLVRPWRYPFIGDHTIGCTKSGKRLDSSPSPSYINQPMYELVLGNMRYTALYTQAHKNVPAILLPSDEYDWQVNDLWEKYHPIFEGNWYDDPNNQLPSKFAIGY